MRLAEAVHVVLWAVLCQWAVGQDDSAARTSCLKSVAKNGSYGGVIEKIIHLDPSRKYYEIYDDKKVYRYQIGLCSTVGESMAAIVQYNATNSNQKWTLGRLDAMHVIQKRDYTELEYFKGQKYNSHCQKTHRTARVMFICDPCGGVGAPAVVEEMTTLAKASTNAHCFYLFEWPTKYACAPDHGYVVVCSAKGGAGAIVVLVLLIVLVLYVIIGVIYKRCFLGAKGVEQFPHVDHWRMCGNLIADGCDCLCRRRRPERVKYSVQPISDDLDMMEESDSEDDNKLLPMS